MIKTLRLSLLSLFAVLCGTVFANDSNLTFTAACNGSGTADDGVAWTVTSDGTESNFDSTKGIHYGTSSGQVTNIVLTTNGIEGTITKVIVNASTASGVTATVGVTVGGNAFGGDAQALTSSATDYTFEGSASGEIVVTVTKPAKAAKALYVKSITVTYSSGNTPQPAANYYVVGSMTNWDVNDAYKMTLNEKAEVEEYVYTMALTTASQFKVVKQDGANQIWYPDGMGNNYGENGEITADGNYKISFRPNGQDGWFNNYIKVEAYAESTLMAEAKELANDADAVAVGKLLDAIATAEATGDETELQAAVDQFKADNAGSELDVTSKVGTGTDKWVNAQNCDAGEFKVYNGNGVNLIQVFGVTGVGDVLTQEVEVENGIYNISLYATSHNAWNGQYGANTAGAPNLQEDADNVAYVFAKSGETTLQTWITARRNSGLVETEPVAYSINGIEVADGKLTFGLALAQAAMTEWHSIQIKSLSKVTTAKAKFAAIKALLNDEITAAKALVGTEGLEAFNTAIGNAETALNDNHLNIAEMEDAIEALKKAEKAFVWAQYTVENPSPEILVNGSCDTQNEGWTLNNMQYQQNNERPTRYIEKWVSAGNDGHLPDVSTKQIFKDMPAGAYVLKGTANAQQQEHADWTIIGASLYVNDAIVAVSGTWKEYQIVYNHEAEGDIEVGFKTESTNANWVGIDQLSLVYYGDYATYVIAAPKKDYQDALAEAQAALEAEKNVTGSEKTALEAEVAKVEPTTAEGYEAATSDLKAATKTFTDAAPNYNYLAAANAAIVDLPYANAEKKPEAKTADNATAAKQAGDELYAALRTYYESNAAAEGKAGATDATELITNAAASDDINGWTTTNGEGSTGSIKVLSNEPWVSADGTAAHNYFDGGDWGKNSWDVSFTQDVTLEPGKYLLSAISRASADVDLKLFAGTDSVKTASIGAADGVFTRGWNIHNVEFEVTEAGAVTIGVRGVTSVLHNWMSFSDFRLVQLEKAAQRTAYNGYIAIATCPAATPGTKAANTDIATAAQTVTIAEAGENSVNITFSGFNMQIPPTVSFKNLTLAANTTSLDENGIKFSSEPTNVTFGGGGMMAINYSATVEGSQATAEATPELVLTMKQATITTIVFAETAEKAQSLLEDILKKAADAAGIQNISGNNEKKTIFNLNGQKLKKAQKGLNIVNGKKLILK